MSGCGGDQPVPASAPAEVLADDGPVVVRHQLIADLPIALVETEVARIDFGAAESRLHLLHGWGREERDSEKSFAWGLGESSGLRFFSSASVPLELVFECRALGFPGADPQSLQIELNGEDLGRLAIEEEFDTFRVEAPARLVRAGENKIRFRYRRANRPRDVLKDSADDRLLAVLWYFLEIRGLRQVDKPEVDERQSTIELPLGSQISYFYDLRPGDELMIGEVVGTGGMWGPGAPRLHLCVETDEGAVLVDQTWDSGQVPRPLRVRLGLDRPRLVRLSLAASRPAPERRWTGFLGRQEEQVSLLLPMVMGEEAPKGADPRGTGAKGSGGPEMVAADSAGESARPNLLIYLIDTLRADHLGTYGYDRPTSPRIDRFADDAAVFLEARAQSSWTRTTVVSVLTGLLPQTHGVNQREDALADPVVTLAEILRGEGYRTLGFITNGNVDKVFGLDQGFDHYQYLRESREATAFHQQSDRVNQQVFRWLDTRPKNDGRPFFLYLHTSDPHAPYTPAEPYSSRFAGDADPELGRIDVVHGISAGREPAPPGIENTWIDLYDGEIAFNDFHFGRLIDRLQQEGLYDDTMIVVLADHGEEFFEHGGWEHGKTLYEEQLRIPLLIKLPGLRGRGARVAGPAGQVDILPTVLEALGLEARAADGQSLLVRMQGEMNGVGRDPGNRESFAYLRLGKRHQESVVARGFKLIRNHARSVSGSGDQLYDLRGDPGELRPADVGARIEGGFLRQTLERLNHDLRLRARGLDPDRAEVDDELRLRLEALGYVD